MVMRKIQLYEVDAFLKEVQMFIEQFIACQHKDLEFLRRDYFAVEDGVIANGLFLCPSLLFLF